MSAAISVHHVEHVMGMAVSIDVRDLPADSDALADVIAWLHRVDATFSTYREDSEVTKVGRGEVGIEDLSPDVEEVFLRCIDLSERTNGAFDAFAVPAPNGTTLDPSGYVKGWSIEHAAHMLTAAGATNLCINAGGDIAIRGVPAPGKPWRVGVRHPDRADKIALTLEFEGPMAIATSATYERGAHILDPLSGEAVTDIASATVVGPDLGIADAFATAVFVMGEDGLEWIETHEGYSAYIITHDGVTRWSSRFPHPSSIEATRQRVRDDAHADK